MTNVEKVLKGLRCLTGMPRCDTCPYSNNPQRQYCLNQIGKDAIKLLKEQPQIVRCKDCKHRYNDNECPYCNECGGRAFPADDWFCADGEHK